jgi:hypothetical protein
MPVDRALWPLRFFRLLRNGGMEEVHYDGWGITHYRRGLEKVMRRLGLRPTEAVISEAPESATPELEEVVVPDRRRSIRRWLRLFVLDENVFCAMRTGGRL